jgi:hypothetical protein
MAGWRSVGLEPSCPSRGCYQQLLSGDAFHARLQEAMARDLADRTGAEIDAFLGDFCALEGEKHVCLSQIRPEAAWEACERLMGIDAPGTASRFLEAQACLGREDGQGALEALSGCLDVPWNPECRFLQALAVALLGRPGEAVERLLDLTRESPSVEALNLTGLLVHGLWDPARGAAFLEKAFAWNGSFPPVQANLAFHRALEALLAGRPLEGLVSLEVFRHVWEGLGPLDRLQVFPWEQARDLEERLIGALGA